MPFLPPNQQRQSTEGNTEGNNTDWIKQQEWIWTSGDKKIPEPGTMYEANQGAEIRRGADPWNRGQTEARRLETEVPCRHRDRIAACDEYILWSFCLQTAAYVQMN